MADERYYLTSDERTIGAIIEGAEERLNRQRIEEAADPPAKGRYTDRPGTVQRFVLTDDWKQIDAEDENSYWWTMGVPIVEDFNKYRKGNVIPVRVYFPDILKQRPETKKDDCIYATFRNNRWELLSIPRERLLGQIVNAAFSQNSARTATATVQLYKQGETAGTVALGTETITAYAIIVNPSTSLPVGTIVHVEWKLGRWEMYTGSCS